MRRTAEFDAFGPWIFEVESAEDVPPLYRAHPVDLDAAELVLKIPRRIWRRDANPDMDLYDNLIVAGPDVLTVLTRRGEAFETVEVPYGRIAAVVSSVSLLDGRFVVHDLESERPSGLAVSLRYNSVSHDMIQRLVAVVREKMLATRPGGADVARSPRGDHGGLALRDLGDDDVALVTEQHELSDRDPAIVPVAMHQRTRVHRRSGVFRSVLDALRPVTLHSAIVCVSPGELHVIHRRQWFTTGKRPAHSVAHTLVPIPLVSSVRVIDASRYVGARAVEITSGTSVIELPFPSGSETGTAIQAALGAVPKT